MPKLKFETKEAVPEGLRDYATEVDGKWEVGVVHESFRDKNINVLKERDTLAGLLGKAKEITGTEDFDAFAAELTELRETAQRVKDGKLTKKDDIEAEIAKRLGEQKGSLEAQIKAQADRAKLAEENGAKFANLWKTSVVENAITQAVMAADSGANPEALPDILSRARQTFRVKDDGSLVAMQGSDVLYGADGENTMKPSEWLGKLVKDAPYLGKTSAGGGATGNPKGVGNTGLTEKQFAELSPADRLTRYRSAQGK